jgi:hypothetical protein
MTPVRHERIVQVRLLDWSNLCWIQDREQFSIGLTLVFFMDPCCLADQTEYSGMACRFPKGRGECRVLAFGLNRNNHDSMRLLETEIGNVPWREATKSKFMQLYQAIYKDSNGHVCKSKKKPC